MFTHRRVRMAGASALALVLIMATAAGILAHAELRTSTPADGAVLDVAPSAVVATYSEAIDPGRSSIIVIDGSGAEVAHGSVDPADAAQKTMRVKLPPSLPPGSYTVCWTTVTPDDNGVERGTFSFTVASPSPSPSASPSAPVPSASATQTPTSASPSADSGSDTVVPIFVAIAVVAIAGGLLAARRRTS